LVLGYIFGFHLGFTILPGGFLQIRRALLKRNLGLLVGCEQNKSGNT